VRFIIIVVVNLGIITRESSAVIAIIFMQVSVYSRRCFLQDVFYNKVDNS